MLTTAVPRIATVEWIMIERSQYTANRPPAAVRVRRFVVGVYQRVSSAEPAGERRRNAEAGSEKNPASEEPCRHVLVRLETHRRAEAYDARREDA
jgi:hypothetical protein